MALAVRAKTKKITLGYTPRKLQALLHAQLRRFNVIVCHRRFGKTVFAINETIDRALRNPLKNPQYAYLAPTYGQAKRVAWNYFKEYAMKIPGAESNEADLRITIPRPGTGDKITFMLLGAENPMALKGIYLDGVILDEYAEMSPTVWGEVIRPTLADRGGWAIFIGTPKGQNGFYKMYQYALSGSDPAWFSALFRASETGIIPPSELQSLKNEMDENEYEQEMECSFQAALVGAYWGKELAAVEREGRLTDVPYDPALPVLTYWDLGLNDTCAIWFVQKHKYSTQWRVIDFDQAPDLGLDEWVRRLRQKPYTYGKFYMPHDISVREMTTGKSRLETMQNLVGRNSIEVIPRIEDKLDSIAAGRRMIAKCVFDKRVAQDHGKKDGQAEGHSGFDALKTYQRKWDSKLEVFSPKPLHNWASNPADAWQTFAMAAEENEETNSPYRDGGDHEAETEFSPYD